MAFTTEGTRKFFSAMADSEGITVRYDKDVRSPHSMRDGSVVLPPPSLHNEEDWEGMAHKEASYLYPENRYLFNGFDHLRPEDAKSPEEAESIAKQKMIGQVSFSLHVITPQLRLSTASVPK